MVKKDFYKYTAHLGEFPLKLILSDWTNLTFDLIRLMYHTLNLTGGSALVFTFPKTLFVHVFIDFINVTVKFTVHFEAEIIYCFIVQGFWTWLPSKM